jgi:hypothetical protein
MARFTVNLASSEELGDFGGAVPAAVHQGDQVSFLLPVELALLAEEPALGLGDLMPSTVRSLMRSDSH